jgi:hypothetical protein
MPVAVLAPQLQSGFAGQGSEPWHRLLNFNQETLTQMSQNDRRRESLVESLRTRYGVADRNADAAAKQALFKEAVYLGIKPEEFTLPV